MPGCRVGGQSGPDLCPGYTAQLPRVIEIARLWGWEKRGSIDTHTRVRGWTLTEPVLDLVDLFAAEQAECERWVIETRAKKGGA